MTVGMPTAKVRDALSAQKGAEMIPTRLHFARQRAESLAATATICRPRAEMSVRSSHTVYLLVLVAGDASLLPTRGSAGKEESTAFGRPSEFSTGRAPF
eukprot:3404734-Rhodomonas_salina.1